MAPNPAGIYLDYAATTPVDPAVMVTMGSFLGLDGVFGNPASGTHRYGLAAADAVETAREQVASLLGCESDEIVWTSGATESINFALKAAALSQRRGDRAHIVTSVLEHRAVLDTVRWLETGSFAVSYVCPDVDGLVTPVPAFGFSGLKPGDRWCLCAPRWAEAYNHDAAPRVYLRRTHRRALEYVPLEILRTFAADLN